MGHAKLVLTTASDDYPDFLKKRAKPNAAQIAEYPEVLVMQSSSGKKALEKLVVAHPGVEIIDNYAEQYAELLLSRNAHLYRARYDVQVSSIKDLLK